MSREEQLLTQIRRRNAEANALSTDPPARMMWTIFALRSATAEARCPGVQVVQANRRLTNCRGPSKFGGAQQPALLGTSSLEPRGRAPEPLPDGPSYSCLTDPPAASILVQTRGGEKAVRR